ncbi:autotransporter outer membrane beta-barrel domain-containing protein [Caulobacter endophyticus]|uniref:autotransporter outer membrane beta-barrel domain-containing protein n=1 Tax=Caulobacter endophyticus TaxID=2172652 RepID=UPI00240F15A1|nr:autotransporter outer membrane beta-barrel domain-containing protein [Caulobacter endophyticus]MDG2528966.1 autotransporter outer membrane beta-barrel domain-containing protein [Caulobacter endophyticus]
MSQRKRASSPSRIGRSPSLWADASALALGAAILAPQAATAATFTASNEAELKAAILAANASADVSSIIRLTQAITLSDPSTMPAALKPITIETDGFGLDNFGYAGTAAVTLSGSSQINFSTNTASTFRSFTLVNSTGLILAGANVTNTSGTSVNGAGILRVDGGRLNTAGLTNTSTGVPATATIEIVNGGVIDMSTATQSTILANGTNINMNMTIDGAGSRLTTANAMGMAAGTAVVMVRNGGTLAVANDFSLGTPTGTTQHHVTITGAGSTLDVGGDIFVARGTLDVLDGAHARSASLLVARSVNQAARLNIAGGAIFDTGTVTMGALTSGNSILSLQTGGVLNATNVTVGYSTTNFGNLVIGDVGAVTGAGTLNATGVFLRATTGALTFNHDTAGYVFATPISGAGTINHLAGDTHLTGDSSAFTGAAYVTGGTLSVEGKLGAAASIFDVRNAGAVARVLTGGELTASTVASSDGGLLSVDGGLLTTGALTLASGDVSVLSGGLLTTTGQVNMGLGTLTLDGGRLEASTLSGSTQTSGSSTIQLLNGGVLNLTGTTSVIANSVNATANLIVSGAGSRFSTANAFSFGTGLGVMTVSDGGTVEFGGRFNVGSPTGLLQHQVTVTGAGSSLIINNGQLYIARGALDLLAGARASASFITLGISANREATLNIAGGSIFDTPGAVAVGSLSSGATAFLNLQTGGVLNSDVVTVGSATRDGEVIIGGKTAIVAAGVLNSPSLFLTGTTGALTFNHDTADYVFATPISGAGTINHKAGLTHLTGDSSTFAGATHVTGGTLYVDGVLGAAGSTLDIQAGSVLGGSGTVGGDVASVGGTIAPGNSPGTLTIAGSLTLDAASTLNVEFGQSNVVGGPMNDLVLVGGNLTLDGTVNVIQTAGGVFDQGLYRIASYGGSLTDNGLAIGALPAGSTVSLQTAIAGQVNLINTTGLSANFWDGDGLLGVSNGAIEGGNGTWTASSSNWTLANGAINAAYTAGDFAIFAGASGLVSVADPVAVGGMQFAVDGYRLTGEQIALNGASATVRVGDGTALGQDYVATIDDVLGGAAQLVKTDLGTLVLNGDNTYAGGTRVSAGTLLVNGDQSGQTGANLVDIYGTLGGVGRLGGDITVNGTLTPGLASAPGVLTLDGDVVLGSTATLRYRLGQAGVAGGALNDLLVVNGDLTLDGSLEVSETAGGAFGVGIYRLIDYTGALTDNGLNVTITPGGAAVSVQTAVDGQINLVNSGGLLVNYWDGQTLGAAGNGVIEGGSGTWTASKTNWTTSTGAVNSTYDPGEFMIFTGAAGTVQASNADGALAVSGMQFAADGYRLTGDAISLEAGDAAVRVGDGTTAGAAFTAVIAAQLTGPGRLDKTDAGTLVLTAANAYAGGTKISGGTLQLGAGGTTGSILGDVANDGVLAFNRSDAVGFTGAISGGGVIAQIGSGVTTLTGDNSAFTGRTEVHAGTLAVTGALGGATEVLRGGRLTGAATLGGLTNGGVVAPGQGVGALTVAGDYAGAGGTLEMEAQLGGAAATADLLVVRGATSGTTAVQVQRLAGGGAPTADGALLVQVDGASDGVFTLANGDYLLDGESVLVGGAYGYVLRKDATGGDWRLRSAQGDSGKPLFQAGAPLYEAYPQTLQLLNGVSTLRQRVGTRQWSGQAVWGRMEGGHSRLEPVVSTTGANLSADRWKMEFGMDKPLAETVMGGRLTGGLTVHYGEVRAKIASANGDGRIDTRGFGFGASLTWAGDGGGYADAQVQGSWFDSDLTSAQLGRRAGGLDGDGYAASLEVGKSMAAGSSLRLTPQAQLTYARTGFQSFTDSFGAVVSDDKGDSLRARLGLAVDRVWSVKDGEGGLYGLVNVSHEFLGGTRVDVSGAPLDARNRRAWVGAAVGGNYSWGQGRYVVYGEAAADTSVSGFGDSYDVTGTAGFRVRF